MGRPLEEYIGVIKKRQQRDSGETAQRWYCLVTIPMLNAQCSMLNVLEQMAESSWAHLAAHIELYFPTQPDLPIYTLE